MDYTELNKETKLFLNKAMDIYSTIEDKSIIKSVRYGFGKKEHEFTKLDKKVLSLFIAGFFADDCYLKEIIYSYDEIKLDNLFDFINIKESDIISKLENQYQEFFEKNFKLLLIRLLRESYWDKKVNFITPEIIVRTLEYPSEIGTDILEYFAEEYDVVKGLGHFFHHPLFLDLEYYIKDSDAIKKDSSEENSDEKPFSIFDSFFPDRKKTARQSEQVNEEQSPSINLEDENIWLLLDDIQKKFIGQEITAQELFYNIVNNQKLAQIKELDDGQRSIIFLDGPTGTGKTAITREITQRLDIPFTATSVTNYSSTGYVGGDITDTLKELYKKANGNLEKAQRGIIVFDEFDKIAYSRSDDLKMKKAIQQQLLDFLGGGKYTLHVGGIFDTKTIEFDTSKLTFICLAALTDLRSQKTEKKQSIGFGSSQQIDQKDYTITPQDLIGFGLERELVGRFNVYLHTNDYSKESLIRILKESTISPLIGFRKWVEASGKKLEIDDDVYDLIVDQAYELNTGARSLQTVMNNIRTPFIKEVLRGPSDTIYLDSETVKKINGQTMNRRGRI